MSALRALPVSRSAPLTCRTARFGPAGEEVRYVWVDDEEAPIPLESDNLISMPEVTATEAARKFADLLDAVEHDGEQYTITRRGRAVAHIEPVTRGRGVDAKALLRRNRPDARWARDLVEVRDLLEVENRP